MCKDDIKNIWKAILGQKKQLACLITDHAGMYKNLADVEEKIVTAEKELLELEEQLAGLMDRESQLLLKHTQDFSNNVKTTFPQKPVEKLTILFLAANTNEMPQLALNKEVHAITDSIRMSADRDSMEFFTRWATQAADILQMINELDPEIIHFSGHGMENGNLLLNDPSGNVQPVSKEAMAAAIATMSGHVRLIFFNACFSEQEAQAVVKYTEAAIGMRKEIPDEAAIVFAAQFYSSIGFGKDLATAFNQAKAALLLRGIVEEATPVLYVKEGMKASDIVMIDQLNKKSGK
ncbi:CHAT domain-containing protein [Pectinatus sottacetonis]|uniref:CHAT domain-containing protein n=1 Tax=Pectinatus sottacetonis TaxID=1002795 RepID=UPI0018C5608C